MITLRWHLPGLDQLTRARNQPLRSQCKDGGIRGQGQSGLRARLICHLGVGPRQLASLLCTLMEDALFSLKVVKLKKHPVGRNPLQLERKVWKAVCPT